MFRNQLGRCKCIAHWYVYAETAQIWSVLHPIRQIIKKNYKYHLQTSLALSQEFDIKIMHHDHHTVAKYIEWQILSKIFHTVQIVV